MSLAPEPTPDAAPRALPRWAGIIVAIVFVSIQIFLEEYHDLVAEYVLVVLSGIGAAVAIFWKKWHRPWFLPSVTVLAAIQVAFFLYRGNAALPPHSGKGLMTVVIVEGAIGSAWLAWMGWLFDPHEKPRTSASRTVEIVLYGFAILAIGTVGFTWWAIEHSLADSLQSLRIASVQKSAVSMSDLLDCLRPTRHAAWDEVPGKYPTRQIYDEIEAVRIDVADEGPLRIVTFATVDARPLSTREKLGIDSCLKP